MTVEAYVEELECRAWLAGLQGADRVVTNDRFTEQTDSVWRVIDSVVRRRMADLHGAPLAPRYYLGLAHLDVHLGHDTEGQRHLDAWLKTPGVTVKDSVLALGMMISSFLRRDITTARIGLARDYVEQLAAFPRAVANHQLLQSRFLMMGAFDGRGQTDSVVAWGLKAVAVLAGMPYEGRVQEIIVNGGGLVTLVRSLAGLPNGYTRIDSLLIVLKREAAPTPAEVARDTLLRVLQQEMQPQAEHLFAQVAWYGKPMPPFIATHWLNHDRPPLVSDAALGARTLALDDGIIRIVAFGWFSCGGCQAGLRNAQKASPLLPKGVEVIFNERSEGTFNGDFVEPEEEAQDLKKWYIDRRHFTFPIAIWAPVKDSTPGGGALPRESPLWKALQISVGPTVYIVDGRGVIRYMGFGFDSYDVQSTQDPMWRALNALVRERDRREHEVQDRNGQDRSPQAVVSEPSPVQSAAR